MSSFGRKFRRNQEKKKALFSGMGDLLEEQSNFCIICKSPRIKMSYEELPEEEKRSFNEMKDFNEMKEEIEYYLFCHKCNEYSFMMGSGSSF